MISSNARQKRSLSHLAHSRHIPRCKSEVKSEIGFPPAVCVGVVRMGERARSAVAGLLPCRPSIFNKTLITALT